MKKTILFYLSAFSIIVSCTKDGDTLEDQFDNQLITFQYHYKGKKFSVDFTRDEETDELKAISEIPEALYELEKIETLASFMSGNDIYYFDSIDEELNYLGLNKNNLLSKNLEEFEVIEEDSGSGGGSGGSNSSGSDGSNSSGSYSITQDRYIAELFNANVECYEHKDFGGAKLEIPLGQYLRNLNKANFNDRISSYLISKNLSRSPIFYWDSDFRGRSFFAVDVSDGSLDNKYGHRNLRDIKTACFLFICNDWNDEISSIDLYL